MIYCDNQSCVKLLENPVFHDRSKHIDTTPNLGPFEAWHG
jgi:hypothetical protein